MALTNADVLKIWVHRHPSVFTSTDMRGLLATTCQTTLSTEREVVALRAEVAELRQLVHQRTEQISAQVETVRRMLLAT